MVVGNKPGATGGFSFGAAPNTTAAGTTPGTSGFSFGNTSFQQGIGAGIGKPTGAATGIQLGGTTSTPAANTGFSFNTALTSTPASQLAKPGSTVTPTVTPGGGFSFGGGGTQAAATTTPGLNLGAASALGGSKPAGSSTPGFSFGLSGTTTAGAGLGTTTTQTVAPTLSAALTTAATTSSSTGGGFAFGQSSTGGLASALKTAPTTTTVASAAAPTLGFQLGGTTTTSATGGGLTLGTATATAKPATGLTTGATATSTSATGFGSASSTTTTTVPSKQMTYQQLEEAINKWTTELTEQENIFLQQATQVNAWDRLVMENGEKIIQLSHDVDRVKTDQQKLDHEIDFIHAQQRELEELLQPLEKSLEQMPPINYQQHADLQREHTYQLAESIDAQMKRMGQDLKETIERLNATSSKTDPEDPVQQITKILNAHMDSLLWIDRNSATLYRRVEDISKEMETQRREQEKNYRLVYN